MRLVIAASVLLLAAGCASTPPAPPRPPTPAEMLVGTWACETAAGPATLKMKPTYKSDGTAAIALDIAGGSGAIAVEASGTAEATWRLLENDTKLEQVLKGVKIAKAVLNGSPIDASMAEGMIAPYIAGQSSTGPVTITPTSLVIGGDNKTTCSRAS